MLQTNRSTVAILMLFVATATGCRESQNNSVLRNFPSEVSDLFYRADSVELISLIPDDQSHSDLKKFHGYPILGSIALTDKKYLGNMANELDRAVDTNDSFGVRCFWPRHGLRAVVKNKTIEILICFQCHRLHVWVDGEHAIVIEMDSTPKPLFNKPLLDAGIQVDAPAAG